MLQPILIKRNPQKFINFRPAEVWTSEFDRSRYHHVIPIKVILGFQNGLSNTTSFLLVFLPFFQGFSTIKQLQFQKKEGLVAVQT